MKRNLLQSHLWQKYEKLENEPTFWIDGDGYEALAIEKSTPVGKYLFCPYGPNLNPDKPNQSLKEAVSGLRSLAFEHDAFFVRVEPTISIPEPIMRELGFIKSHDIEPAHTWVLDLTQSESDLLSGIEKTKVRHWRNHQKKGLSLRTSTDPTEAKILASLLQGVSNRDHFTPQDQKHLENQLKAGFATLYIAEYEQKPIAASLVYDYDGTRYYAHAATDGEYKKLMAGTVLLVQMILDAQHNGAKTFDFWGITTSTDPHHPWHGFTEYKKSFGGHQVDYTGTWDLPLHRVRYHLYQMLRSANRFKRKHFRQK